MKTKPMIMTHGNLILPLTVGQKARYCQNGIWKTTGRVRQIIEQTEDYVKFETDSVRYCIDHYGRDVYKRQMQGFGRCEPAGNCTDAVGWRKVRV